MIRTSCILSYNLGIIPCNCVVIVKRHCWLHQVSQLFQKTGKMVLMEITLLVGSTHKCAIILIPTCFLFSTSSDFQQVSSCQVNTLCFSLLSPRLWKATQGLSTLKLMVRFIFRTLSSVRIHLSLANLQNLLALCIPLVCTVSITWSLQLEMRSGDSLKSKCNHIYIQLFENYKKNIGWWQTFYFRTLSRCWAKQGDAKLEKHSCHSSAGVETAMTLIGSYLGYSAGNLWVQLQWLSQKGQKLALRITASLGKKAKANLVHKDGVTHVCVGAQHSSHGSAHGTLQRCLQSRQKLSAGLWDELEGRNLTSNKTGCAKSYWGTDLCACLARHHSAPHEHSKTAVVKSLPVECCPWPQPEPQRSLAGVCSGTSGCPAFDQKVSWAESLKLYIFQGFREVFLFHSVDIKCLDL